MLIEVNLTQLIFIVTAVFSGLWVLFKSFWISHERGMDKRFTALLESIGKTQQQHAELDRALLQFQSEVSMAYLRREEYLRDVELLREAMQRELEPLRKSVARIEDYLISAGKNHGV